MRDKLNSSIRNKLMTMSAAIALIVMLLLGLVAWAGFQEMKQRSYELGEDLVEFSTKTSKKIISSQVEIELEHLAEAASHTVDARVQMLMDQSKIVAMYMEELYANPDQYQRIPVLPADAKNKGKYVSQVVYAERTNPAAVADELGLLGNLSTIMLEVSENLTGVSSTYIGTKSGIIIMYDDRSDLKVNMGNLDPVTRSWYTSAVNKGKAIWTPVFEDNYGRGLTITCGYPAYDEDGNVLAVVAIGAQLTDISDALADIKIGESGSAFVVDEYGDIIMKTELTEGDDDITEKQNLYNTKHPGLDHIIENMQDGVSGVASVDIEGKEMFWAYEPMKCMPWTVVTVVDSDEVLTPVYEGEEKANEMALTARAEIESMGWGVRVVMAVGMIFSSIFAIFVGTFYANHISNPIQKLQAAVKKVAKGDLDDEIKIKTGDEIEDLADSFNLMTRDLKRHIKELTEVTAEKEKIGAELGVATEIQISMLPKRFPTLEGFEVHATMDPAKQVGGDFYDVGMLDDDHLGILVGDVSGKGVPAALFMVRAIALFQSQRDGGVAPAKVLKYVNEQLCQHNEAGMFVTVWLASVNIHTGKMTYASAGHNPALLRKKDGKFRELQTDANLVLAGMEGIDFVQSETYLEKGDVLFIYTDGVTEATNAAEEQYSLQRLIDDADILVDNGVSAKGLLKGIRQCVDNFAQGEDQFDDITMLALNYDQNQK